MPGADMDPNDELAGINAWSVDQADLEQDLAVKASQQLADRENELDDKRLGKTRAKIADINAHIALLTDRIADPRTKISLREKYRDDIYNLQRKELKALRQDEEEILERIDQRKTTTSGASILGSGGAKRQADETEREFLIRTGKITPFMPQSAAANQDLDQEDSAERSHRDLARPAAMLERSVKRRKSSHSKDEEELEDVKSESEYEEALTEGSETDEEAPVLISQVEDDPRKDDGDITVFTRRMHKWNKSRAALRARKGPVDSNNDEPEWKLPHPEYPDMVIDKKNDFRIPGDIWASLFAYQKTGVRWLWELYNQKAGGIIGDEMGLGKTVQVAAFLAGLHYSGKLKRPALIVCPATVLHQWVAELHQWWPPLRVSILHSIGTGMNGTGNLENDLQNDDDDEEFLSKAPSSSQTNAKNVVQSIMETGNVIVTTYAGLRIYRSILIPKLWGYCCLDEGHKIRNPNSDIALTSKQVKTPYRLILSGTPIQNNLTELWSLFDFVFPGRLGTLPIFQNQFSVPINVGGYANASNIQVQTAYKCAVVLRNSISPYLLRRMKSDVAADLPQKTEKVLFCKMTKYQHDAYSQFLKSDEMTSIMKGKRQVLYGVDILRKICNHPDLLLLDKNSTSLGEYGYGNPTKSGKMQVVKALLDLWTSQGHRTLLFCQTRQVLDIIEKFVQNLNLNYMRMDGTTAIGNRQKLVDEFNNNIEHQVFLLTTKVGGLGVNLTGANRVIIFDPDWNPSTDIQARERAWRLGQKKEVMIYRLMISGSIEEKIYHRQIFKQFLTNKILKDPKQKRFFKNTDLHDLFSLGDGSETSGLFAGAESKPKSREQSPDDVGHLAGIKGQDDYQVEEDKPKAGDEGILEGIFAKAGVQSTVEHDAVMEASRPDTVLMEREATRIAHQAAEALKVSRNEARKHKIGTPTWTGRFGKAGKDPKERSSTSILANLRNKRELETKATSGAAISSVQLNPHTAQLEKIRAYIASKPDFTSKSADIVKAVNIQLEGDQAVANLRKMLNQIASWDSEKSAWELKEEFR